MDELIAYLKGGRPAEDFPRFVIDGRAYPRATFVGHHGSSGSSNVGATQPSSMFRMTAASTIYLTNTGRSSADSRENAISFLHRRGPTTQESETSILIRHHRLEEGDHVVIHLGQNLYGFVGYSDAHAPSVWSANRKDQNGSTHSCRDRTRSSNTFPPTEAVQLFDIPAP